MRHKQMEQAVAVVVVFGVVLAEALVSTAERLVLGCLAAAAVEVMVVVAQVALAVLVILKYGSTRNESSKN
tara:strand:- start:110 stop:322 length:213 start_codon:yes stop_codon:yes gene_type:complete